MSNDETIPLRAYREVVPTTTPFASAKAALLRSFSPSPSAGLKLLPWLKGYNRSKFTRDAVAACVVATVLVPQSMSYALLAGVDPVYGLYSSVTPLFTYGLLTTSSSLAAGPVAPTAILMNGMVRDYTGAEDRTPAFTSAMLQLAFASGVVLSGMVVLRVGWVADLLSFPVVSGFTSGAACIIIASQLSDLFGIPVPRERDFFRRLQRAGENALRANPHSAAIGAVCLVVLLYAKEVSVGGRRLPKLTPVPLIVLALMTGVSYALDLAGKGVKVVGSIPSALPSPSFPFSGPSAGDDFARILPSAALLSVVSYVQTLSVGTVFARKTGEKLGVSREMMACALSNIVGGCFQCIQVSGSFTRTAVQHGAGAVTPMCGILVGCIMVVAVITLTRVLAHLPMCVLAAVVVSSTRALLDPSEAVALWRGKPTDFLQLAATFVSVLVLDVQNGLFAGIAFSFALVLYRSFQPRIEELARLPDTDTYVAVSRYPDAVKSPGVLILRVDGEVSFGNCRKLGEVLREPLVLHAAALAALTAAPQLEGGAPAAVGGGASPGSGGEGAGVPAATAVAISPPVPAGAAPAVASPPPVTLGGRKALHTRTRTVYALAFLREGKDRLAALLSGGTGGVASPRRGGALELDSDDEGAEDIGDDADALATGAAVGSGGATARLRSRRGGGVGASWAPDFIGEQHDGTDEVSEISSISAADATGTGPVAVQSQPLSASPKAPLLESRSTPADAKPARRRETSTNPHRQHPSQRPPPPPPSRWKPLRPHVLRAVILDCSRVVDIDATGCRELQEVMETFDKAKVPLILAGLPGPVRDTMTAFGIDKQQLDRPGDALPQQPPVGSATQQQLLANNAAAGSGGAAASAPRDGSSAALDPEGGGTGDAQLSLSSPAAAPRAVSGAPQIPRLAAVPGAALVEPFHLCDGARRAILRSLATRYLSVAAAVAAVEAAYDQQAAFLVAACANYGVTHWCSGEQPHPINAYLVICARLELGHPFNLTRYCSQPLLFCCSTLQIRSILTASKAAS